MRFHWIYTHKFCRLTLLRSGSFIGVKFYLRGFSCGTLQMWKRGIVEFVRGKAGYQLSCVLSSQQYQGTTSKDAEREPETRIQFQFITMLKKSPFVSNQIDNCQLSPDLAPEGVLHLLISNFCSRCQQSEGVRGDLCSQLLGGDEGKRQEKEVDFALPQMFKEVCKGRFRMAQILFRL